MSTRKKQKSTSQNKTKKNKDISVQLFKFKGQKEYPRGLNGSYLRYSKNNKTKKVKAKNRKNWPADILAIFDSIDKWPWGGPKDTRKQLSQKKSIKKSKKEKLSETKTDIQPNPIEISDEPKKSPIKETIKIEEPKKVNSKYTILEETDSEDDDTPTLIQNKQNFDNITPRSLSPLEIEKKERSPYMDQCEKLQDRLKESKEKFDINNPDFQKLLKCVENKNKNNFKNDNDNTIYPSLDDPNFTLKLTKKKEFKDVQIQKKTREQIENIESESNNLCRGNIEFELEPHQMFVRNFLSFETPYKSLLIFHGLGTGKTCSSITVCEELRTYYKQLGINKKIMIVASPVVQDNYKLQLFDKRKLKKINGLWNIKACTGNKFIKEVNPMNMKGLTKEKIVKQINKIIRQSYEFIGYIEFANKIDKMVKKINLIDNDKKRRRKINLIKREFSNRLLVIDEVHNIRALHGSKRRTTQNMLDLVQYAENMKLLLLTATPMFNDAMEIIWLLNLMNLNDKRFPLQIQDVFDQNGSFVIDETGEEIGKELLIQKLTGYVSYVSGENPFTFPSRIWPEYTQNPHSILKLKKEGWNYPSSQINGLDITNEMQIKYLDLIIAKVSPEQEKAYNYVVSREKEKNPILNEPRQGLKYTIIDGPLQILNMTYPHDDIDEPDDNIEKYLYGKGGLNRVMLYNKNTKKEFRYTDSIRDTYGRIFSSNGENPPLKKYSSKIYSIIKKIKESEGIVLIYSQYIDGGCVPLALALEEIGITRYGDKSKSLFKTPPVPNMKVNGNDAKYVMITGDALLSPGKSKNEIIACTNQSNINGEKVKVIIISKAGSEGVDFKNIRQVHILEPWYNLNRADQIIGRGVRNKSHCSLPYNKRTVEIFMYGTELSSNVEAIDLYVYRLAEYKSVRIGNITRILKENSVDCLINKNQQDMIAEKMNKNVNLKLSNGKEISFPIGYKNNSIICDFMNCNYSCNPTAATDDNVTVDTYSENFIIMNLEKILQRIKQLFKEHYIYEKNDLINKINAIKYYSPEQINLALHTLIHDKNEFLTDMINRNGRLINIDNFYLFQPINLDDNYLTHYERKHPIDYRAEHITFKLPKNIKEFVVESKKQETNLLSEIKEKYNHLLQPKKVKKKKDWVQWAAWSIENLVKYNSLNKELLLTYALEHIFDVYSIEKKVIILNELFAIENKDEIETKLESIVNKFIVNINGDLGMGVANYFKRTIKKSKVDYTVITFKKETKTWSIKSKLARATQVKMVRQTLNKFKLKPTIYNPSIIGFLTKHQNNIVFKTKAPVSSRKSKGIQCPSAGEKRKVTIKRLNDLLKNINPEEKYRLAPSKGKSKSNVSIISIYGDTNIDQRYGTKSKDISPISDLQLCVETELVLRYLDDTQHNDKKWFISTIEDTINDVKNVQIKP